MGRPVDYIDVVGPEFGNDILNWSICDQAEIPTARHGLFREAWRGSGVLDANFVGSKMKGPFARSIFPCRHVENALIKLKSNVNVADTKYNMVEATDFHF
ncbi:MAG: hypothetical protein QNJ16_10100 [Rhodobacter sp.]|nr:hypothetical protein [Rhodobacter sp.]